MRWAAASSCRRSGSSVPAGAGAAASGGGPASICACWTSTRPRRVRNASATAASTRGKAGDTVAVGRGKVRCRRRTARGWGSGTRSSANRLGSRSWPARRPCRKRRRGRADASRSTLIEMKCLFSSSAAMNPSSGTTPALHDVTPVTGRVADGEEDRRRGPRRRARAVPPGPMDTKSGPGFGRAGAGRGSGESAGSCRAPGDELLVVQLGVEAPPAR